MVIYARKAGTALVGGSPRGYEFSYNHFSPQFQLAQRQIKGDIATDRLRAEKQPTLSFSESQSNYSTCNSNFTTDAAVTLAKRGVS